MLAWANSSLAAPIISPQVSGRRPVSGVVIVSLMLTQLTVSIPSDVTTHSLYYTLVLLTGDIKLGN